MAGTAQVAPFSVLARGRSRALFRRVHGSRSARSAAPERVPINAVDDLVGHGIERVTSACVDPTNQFRLQCDY
jgi:hypothetical protein